MKILATATMVTAAMVLATGCSSKKEDKKTPELTSVMEENISKDSVNKHITEWPEASKKATKFMMDKYGLPDGVTENTLVWTEVGPYTRSIVYKEEIPHHFPREHTDVLEHTINYKAPTSDTVGQIWDFDGSVILDRTKGEMSARCDREEANILALNLAHEIVQGERSVEEARIEYGRQITSMMDGNPSYYTKTLVFSPADEKAGDPDHSIVDKLRKEGTGPMEAQEADYE
jgi:hypothetical protein